MSFEIKVEKSDINSSAIAHFTNGRPREKEAKGINFIQIQSDKATLKGKRKRSVVAETANMTYAGDNSGTYAPISSSHCKYMVGVFNRKKGKMRVLNTEMFNLRPTTIVTEEEEKPKEEPATKTMREKKDDLTSAFGSARKRKAMTSRLKNQLKGEALEEAVGSVVQQALEENRDVTTTPTPKSDDAATNIPPYNIDAIKPQDVYKFEDIISQEEMEALKTPARTFVNANPTMIAEWKEKKTYPRLIVQHLSVLPLAEEARLRKACILTHLHYMVSLYHMKAAQLRNKIPFPEEMAVPECVKKGLLDKFTLKTGVRCMPKRLKDKLVSYILVLCLILDEFNLDIMHLQGDLVMGTMRLRMFLQALGCNLKGKFIQLSDGTKSKLTIATLPIPLTFPNLKKGAGKGKR